MLFVYGTFRFGSLFARPVVVQTGTLQQYSYFERYSHRVRYSWPNVIGVLRQQRSQRISQRPQDRKLALMTL